MQASLVSTFGLQYKYIQNLTFHLQYIYIKKKIQNTSHPFCVISNTKLKNSLIFKLLFFTKSDAAFKYLSFINQSHDFHDWIYDAKHLEQARAPFFVL